MATPSAQPSSWQVWVAFTLLFLIFFTITYDHSKAWNNPNRGDQDLDLNLGLKIRHFEALSDGYHHPLLPALVAPFAEKDLRYFAKAKLVNVAIGAVAFWVVAWVGWRLVGPGPTFLALVALSPGLSNKSAEFTAEPLLLLLIVLTFYWLVQGFDRPWAWGVAGACAGLAYLTKGSALLLLVAYAGCVLRIAPKWIVQPQVWLFPVAFLCVSSPLLLYNWHIYGWPFFNYNTAHVIWLDSTEEQMIMFEGGPPTMFSYLASHSLEDIARRWLTGMVKVRGVEWVWPFLLLFLVLPKKWLAYFGAFPEKRTMIAVATTLVLTFYLPFAWSAVIQRGIRFLLPIFPIMFLLLADIVIFYSLRLAYWIWAPATRVRLAAVAMWGTLAVLGFTWCVQLGLRDFQSPLAIDFEDRATAELYQLLDTPAFDGKRILFGPSHTFTGTWLFRHDVAFPIIPPGLSAEEFLPWLQRQGIDYILANKEMIRRRKETVKNHLAFDEIQGVRVLRMEPRWEVIYRGPSPSKFVLIRLE
ncbi:MAG TPA: hypothetical protein VNP04_04005 [Alphaproteobacteria bacterium]|nr:hypothetical protein [Alphaproteobacteria bacterium]